jgi:hypothetical protein
MNIRTISSNQIAVWSALLIGLLAAVAIGSAVGSSDTRPVAVVIALSAAVVVFVKLKTNIWVLLPIGWYLAGRVTLLPIPFSLRDLCFMAVIACFVLFLATRVVPWKRKISMLDYLIYINLAYLATVYIRNPVGVYAMQTSMVGGRPYFETLLATGAYLILSRTTPSDAVARMFPLFYLIPTGVVAVLDIVARIMPQFSYPLAMIYSGVGSISPTASLQDSAEVGRDRITGLRDVGSVGVLALCARYSPATLITPLYPWRLLLFLSALVAMFLSGFRAALFAAIVFFLLSAFIRKRVPDIIIAAGSGVLLLTLLISLQGSVIQLPLTMQRALSWLPGEWNQEAVEDAEGSTRWRFEMVEWAWNDTTVLRNKIWGQGIGFSLDDMNLIAAMITSREAGINLLGGSDREQFMITGTFHNGPISAIRCVGIVGLCLYAVLIIYLSVHAWKLCKAALGTKAFPLALFVGLPIIYFPFAFFVLTGFYESDLAVTIFSAGLLNLTTNYFHSVGTQKRTSKENAAASKSHGQDATSARPMLARMPARFGGDPNLASSRS